MTPTTPSVHTFHTESAQPSVLNGALIWVIDQATTARLIYSSNQALINSGTWVRPPLKLVVITHRTSMEKTNNQNITNASLSRGLD